jgi:hypothetical protein
MSSVFVDPLGRLALALHEADAQVNRASATLALAEARLRLLDATFADIKALAQQANIPFSNASEVPAPMQVPMHMSEPDFARHMCISPRTLATERKDMMEGVHYHHTGRRIIYHVAEAGEFLRGRARRAVLAGTDDVERLAIDEVTRRRARVALRRTGGTS